jgi:antirestriction protein ArdC
MTTPVPSRSGMDVHRSISETISAAIAAGAATHVMPWHRSAVGGHRPINVVSREAYRGINAVALWAEATLAGFSDRRWATYSQWQSVGGQVKRGERGASIVYYAERAASEMAALGFAEGEPRVRFEARSFRVFNAAQVVGWARADPPTDSIIWGGFGPPETFIDLTGADILHHGERSYYDRREDRICVPPRESFVGSRVSTPTENYYATVLHELVHWTGAPHRLDRPLDGLSGEPYATEELIAELGAALLCSDLGVSNAPRADHAVHIAGWLGTIANDHCAIFRAARCAQMAVDCLQAEITA